MRESLGAWYRRTTSYQWIRRPDGSVFRQLNPKCPRAALQYFMKGKGANRVHPRG
jgi:hypothetical protein